MSDSLEDKAVVEQFGKMLMPFGRRCPFVIRQNVCVTNYFRYLINFLFWLIMLDQCVSSNQ